MAHRRHTKRELHAEYRRIWHGEKAHFSRLKRNDLMVSNRGVIVSKLKHEMGNALQQNYTYGRLWYSANVEQQERRAKFEALPITRRFRTRVWNKLKSFAPRNPDRLANWANYIKLGKGETDMRLAMEEVQCLMAVAFDFKPTIDITQCPWITEEQLQTPEAVARGDLSVAGWKRLRRLLPLPPTEPIDTRAVAGRTMPPNQAHLQWFRDLENITGIRPMDVELLPPNASAALKDLHATYVATILTQLERVKAEQEEARQRKVEAGIPLKEQEQKQLATVSIVVKNMKEAQVRAFMKRERRIARKFAKRASIHGGKLLGRIGLGILTLGIYPAVRGAVKTSEKLLRGTRFDPDKLGDDEKRDLHDLRCQKLGKDLKFDPKWNPNLTRAERRWLAERRAAGKGRAHVVPGVKRAVQKFQKATLMS